jgi:amino acid permease
LYRSLQCFGVSCSYLIIVKTLTPPALTTIYNLLTSDDNVPPAILRSGPFWLLASMALAIPLSFFKRLDSYVSASNLPRRSTC